MLQPMRDTLQTSIQNPDRVWLQDTLLDELRLLLQPLAHLFAVARARGEPFAQFELLPMSGVKECR